MQPLKDHQGKYSAKRIAGWALMFVCVLSFFIDLFSKYKANDILFGTLFAGALALLGVETIVNGINNRRNNQRQRRRGVKDDEDI